MAQVDEFLRDKVTPLLASGETIDGMGLLARPTKLNALGVPQRWEAWFGVATPTRLICFETQTGGPLGRKAKPIAGKMIEWRYDEIERVELGMVTGFTTGRTMTLWPHRLCGPFPQEDESKRGEEVRRYDLYSKASGLDGHVEFIKTFPKWLHDQVEAGAFPMTPEGRAEVDARIKAAEAKAEAEEAARVQRAAEKSAARKAARPKILRAIFAAFLVLCTLGCGGGAIFAFVEVFDDGFERHADELKRAKSDLKWAKAGYKSSKKFKGLTKTRCPDAPACHDCYVTDTKPPDVESYGRPVVKKRKGLYWQCPDVSRYEMNLDDAQDSVSEDYLVIGLGVGSAAGVLFFPFIGLVFFVRARLRKKKAEQPQ